MSMLQKLERSVRADILKDRIKVVEKKGQEDKEANDNEINNFIFTNGPIGS